MTAADLIARVRFLARVYLSADYRADLLGTFVAWVGRHLPRRHR